MKHIYEIRVDAWRTYSGYFTSLDQAFLILPGCPSFRKAMSYRRATNVEKLPETFTFTKDHGVWDIRGVCEVITRFYEVIPEMKQPGVPYQPASTKEIGRSVETKELTFGFLEVFEIPLDIKQEA